MKLISGIICRMRREYDFWLCPFCGKKGLLILVGSYLNSGAPPCCRRWQFLDWYKEFDDFTIEEWYDDLVREELNLPDLLNSFSDVFSRTENQS